MIEINKKIREIAHKYQIETTQAYESIKVSLDENNSKLNNINESNNNI